MKQISLTDVFTPTAEKLRWQDTNIQAHHEYLVRLEQTAEQLDGRTDHAGRWAREVLEAEAAHVRAALAGVQSIEAEREAWRGGLAECDAAQRAIDAAKTVKTLVDARAGLELAGRAAGAAFETFKTTAHASRLPPPSMRPLFNGWRAALEPIDDLNRHTETLDAFAPGSSTFRESAAYDAARAHAQCDLAALPYVIARTDPTSRTFRLWFHFAAKKHGISGAETYKQIFAQAAE
jgi:hypothetical protein